MGTSALNVTNFGAFLLSRLLVLLELVSGKKPAGEFGDGVDIVQWVRKMTDSNKQAVTNILDPRLSSVPLHDVMHVFYVAMLCVEEQSVERPTMREVVQILSELPRPTPKPEEEDSSNSEECGAPAPVPSAETPRKETKEQQQQPAPRSPPPDLLSI